MKQAVLAGIGVLVTVGLLQALPQTGAMNQAPTGFTSLFNGKDLTGWRGRQMDYSPHVEAKLSPEELAAKQVQWNANRDMHWKVDVAKGEIVSDGNGVFLATDQDYGDFELYVDWLMVNHNGDSGIYLRGYPQVQVWDPDNPREARNGGPKGSGGLYNNSAGSPGKDALVKADNPVGSWNTFHIKMIGERVSVWLNDKQTVDNQVFENGYFCGNGKCGEPGVTVPVLPKGPIELQTHGSEIRFRNIYVRRIDAAEAKAAAPVGPARPVAAPAATAPAPTPSPTTR